MLSFLQQDADSGSHLVCQISSMILSTTGLPITVSVNEQVHLKPSSGLVSSTRGATTELQLLPGPTLLLQKRQLIGLVATSLSVDASQVYEVEALLYDTQPAATGGMESELVFAQRLDDLCMSYCALIGLLESLDDEPSFTTGNTVRMISFSDHKEIGSVSQGGTRSDFLPSVLRRISRPSVAECQPSNSSSNEQMMARSFLMSADMMHGLHPNLQAKDEDSREPLLNSGLVIKTDANMEFARTALAIVLLRTMANHASVPLQMFVGNNNAACRGAIGPLLAAQLGVRGVEVGLTH
jgi:aspartyl aminopeptidase